MRGGLHTSTALAAFSFAEVRGDTIARNVTPQQAACPSGVQLEFGGPHIMRVRVQLPYRVAVFPHRVETYMQEVAL